ncbi:phosphate ABC transporter permease subunit PstC [Pontimonas sp.]|jgi:phosphate transport system permease protein|nr:phosphate ABC transporter permease subunit PstC [Pontimonas sp.]MDA8863139.1 phosphate ABC transporter permease subunit PstC [Pontimonas sp.]
MPEEPAERALARTAGGKTSERPGDRIFSGSAKSAGTFILVILAAVSAFLLVEGFPALVADPAEIGIFDGDNFWQWVFPLVYGTLWAAALALVMSFPLAIGIALFISHYAPRRIAATLGYLVDLLAAVPSVVYGLWGAAVLAPALQPSYTWLAENLSFIPFFAGPASGTGRTILTAAIVLGVMVLPIITAVSREVFLQTPVLYEEASLALGSTRWEMIRTVVLPVGRGGIISAAMLGLGRALGETLAVAMVLSATGVITVNLISSVNPSTIAANVALSFPEAYGLNVNALIASGLILFAITLVVNSIARWIVNRRADFSGAN